MKGESLMFDWKYVHPTLKEALQTRNLENLLDLMAEDTILAGVFYFPFFSNEFCSMIISELEDAEKSAKKLDRPNSMSKFIFKVVRFMSKRSGFVLTNLGFRDFTAHILNECVVPLTELLYGKEWSSKCETDHSFVIQYAKGQDTRLDLHQDISDITLNICLGKSFTGSRVVFHGIQKSTLPVPPFLKGANRDLFQTRVNLEPGWAGNLISP
jgi:hypothetical protein